MKFDGTYTPTQSRVFVNLQNNVWHTNFRDWFSGRIEARIRLWSFRRFENASALVVPSMNGKRPLLAAVADGPGGTLPASQTGITVSRSGVLVTAFGANPDGDGTLLRLWDQSGVSGPVNIVFPQGLCGAVLQPIDLRGRKAGEPIAIQGGDHADSTRSICPCQLPLAALATHEIGSQITNIDKMDANVLIATGRCRWLLTELPASPVPTKEFSDVCLPSRS